jgi:asparagine synthase (glutamine-hydrolysing)
MLAGQGADELFGGYERYVNLYLLAGKDKAEEAIRKDMLRMHETNFERDFKVSNYNDIELRLPLASFPVASFALNLPLALKIEPNDKTLRKLILRKAAERLGLPQKIVCKPKKAVQYSTGVSEALKKIAKKNGLSVQAYVQSVFEFKFRNDAD